MANPTYRFKAVAFAATLLAGLATIPSTHAAAYQIDGSVSYDEGFAAGNIAGGLTGTFSGATTNSTFVGATVTGSNPVAGTLIQAGDGVGFNARAGSTGIDGAFAGGSNYSVTLFNASATTWRFSFLASYDIHVDSNGADAYADSELSLSDPLGELFGTRIQSDSANGNRIDGQLQNGPGGGALNRSGVYAFDVDLLAGDSTVLSGFWTLNGGSFADPGAADSTIDFFLRLDSITQRGGSTGVPLPGSLSLVALGLAALGWRRRARLN